MKKVQQRQQARNTRLQLARRATPETITALSSTLVEAIQSRPAQCVAGYWPMPGEADIRPALKRLASEGALLALPVVTGAGIPLTFRRWQPGDILHRGPLGTSEPADAAEAVRPDVIIVPLLAFDSAGYRIGHGGGYYDRTLAALRSQGPRPWAVGAAYHGQIIDRVCRDAHDERLDAVATERGLTIFPGRK